jgi:hypothetical protein
MLWQLYLRHGTVYVPTVAQTEAGFYMDVEPVKTVAITDSKALQDAIKDAISKGNPIVPTPTRAAFPKPVVLKYVKMKSWSSFEKEALNWTIVEKAGNYQIKPGRRRLDNGWEEDPTKIESLPPGTELDAVAQRVTSLVQSAVGDDHG